MQKERKNAFIFAGANASGKSTLISFLLQNGIIAGEYINPDLILKYELGLEETPKNYLRAFKIAKERREKAIECKRDIILETTFSAKNWIGFCNDLKTEGYYVTLIFTMTNNPYINAFYLMKRVQEGGHDVPLRALLQRRERGLRNVREVANIVDCLILIDNSMIGEPPAIVKGLYQNRLCYNPVVEREIEWLDEIGLDFNLPELSEENEMVQFCMLIQERIETFSEMFDMPYEKKNAILQEYAQFKNEQSPNYTHIKRRMKP